ncbi:hypothetical protein PV729_26575 [Streptomyces europaeiscabiei]|uniref:Uncharacterized protein n=1 Tax=Streptomyces europaeiscabiei TaxID=146819 RepID=A0ABU4NT84_9ACTN|nr:hypothetical protein [Streptomyces europaeiscabiei]MDX3555288.1 hypothetical protein [Streptomyces europaeiscabiei]MDX3705302.1 hypothetical protein [Streptomyces europaeiscabiei]
MTDVVYVAGPWDRNEELRFSLRSLAAHLPHGRVWVAGHRPPWLADTVGHIQVPQKQSRFQSSTANLRAACEHPEVSEEFVYFNDDFFVMEPVEQVPVLHRGPVADVIAETRSSLYRRGAQATALLMERLGLDEDGPLLSYEMHAPLPVGKKLMLEAMAVGAKLPVLHKRTLYGNLHRIGGDQAVDVKVKAHDDLGPAGPWLSTTDASFESGAVGERIRAAFSEPCRYEADYVPPPAGVPAASAEGPEPPSQRASKADWVAYADTQDPADHSDMTKAQLIDQYGR